MEMEGDAGVPQSSEEFIIIIIMMINSIYVFEDDILWGGSERLEEHPEHFSFRFSTFQSFY